MCEYGALVRAVGRLLVPARKRHGFDVLFALVDRGANMFTWAIHHPGDIEVAAKGYYADPERVELEIVERYVTDYTIAISG